MTMDLRLVFVSILFFVKYSSEKVDNGTKAAVVRTTSAHGRNRDKAVQAGYQNEMALLEFFGLEDCDRTVKICVVADPKTKPGHITKYCDLLARSKKSPVTCVYGTDRLHCLRIVSARDADFTILDPEDLYFATLWDESAVLVVSEVRAIREMSYKYGIVVVVNNSLNLTGVDLRGKKLCHPGLKSGSKWNDLFAQYLEERLAPRNCEPELTVFEDRAKTSANFFGYSCKAGPWTEDEAEDIRLKNEYATLCSLCEMGECSNSEKYRGSAGSLMCLTDGVGDVLWARYDDVVTYFKKFSSDESNISQSDYSFLCEDGTLKPLDTSDPCFWLAMPWQVVAANRKSTNEVQKVFYDFGSSEWERNLVEVIESYLHFIVSLQVPKTPEDFLKSVPGYLSALEMSQGSCKPKHSVSLCTTSPLEQSKCVWMAKAALSVALQPPLECVETANISSCVEAVANGTADVVIVPPDYAMDATTEYGLSTLYYEVSSQMSQGYLLSAYVKEDSTLKFLSDLKRKRACFTRVGSVGWNSALVVLEKAGFTESSCREKETLLGFFEEVCVVSSTGMDVPTCCNRTHSDETDGAGALNCLFEGGCDVAFVDNHTVQEDSEKKEYKSKRLRAICPLRKTDGCFWFWSHPNYLMINSQVSRVKYREMSSLLTLIGDVFGRKSKADNRILEIFGPFNGFRNVLFKDSSVAFSSKSDFQPNENYLSVIGSLDDCSAGGRALESLLFISFLFLVNSLLK